MSAVPTRLPNHCHTCNREFIAFQKTQRFCSADCRKKARFTGVHEARRLESRFDASALVEAVRGWLKPEPEVIA